MHTSEEHREQHPLSWLNQQRSRLRTVVLHEETDQPFVVDTQHKQPSHRKEGESEEDVEDAYVGQLVSEVETEEVAEFSEEVETELLEVALKKHE